MKQTLRIGAPFLQELRAGPDHAVATGLRPRDHAVTVQHPVWCIACSTSSTSVVRDGAVSIDEEDGMRVSDIMTTRVETVTPGESADAAFARMRSAKIHHLVVMERGKVVGLLSARDLGRPEERSSRQRKTVGELMSSAPVCAGPEMPLHRAANVLRGRNIGSLPVVKGRKLLGILTISDLLEVLGRYGTPGREGRRSPWRRGARTWTTHVAELGVRR